MNPSIEKADLYVRALTRLYQRGIDEDDRESIKKLVVLTVYFVINYSLPDQYTLKQAREAFQFVECIRSYMAEFTPTEFTNLFPIKKEYDGEKYGMKDYFTARKYIDTLPQDEPIGANIDRFLWEYWNDDLFEFGAQCFLIASRLRCAQTGESIGEALAAKMGLKTYSLHTDTDGKQYLLDDETGKTARINSKRPSYLKVVK
jgi:hypothetical protein